MSIDTPLGEDILLLSRFSGREAVSRFFNYNLDLLSEKKDISFDDIVGKQVTIKMQFAGGENERYFNGYVSRFAQAGSDSTFTQYRMEVVPWLWFLTRNANCKIFQNMSVTDIIQQVFSDRGFSSKCKPNTTGSYEPLDYCVQYRETDFNFVSRLMEENGIYYFFEHEDGDHTLVLSDSASGPQKCPVQSSARYAAGTSKNAEDTINSWQIEQELRTGKYTLTDYNFETPTANLVSSETTVVSVGGNDKYELFDYPGNFLTPSDGTDVAKVRMQEEEAGTIIAGGSGNCRSFASTRTLGGTP